MFYVYRHIRLDTGKPFYVGKGKLKRAWDTRCRNDYWKCIVKVTSYKIEILKSQMSEQEAFALERQLISAYKSYGLCEANFSFGGDGPSGLKWTIEQKTKLSNSKKGTKLSEAHKCSIKNSVSGSKNGFYGKKHSEEFISWITEKNKGMCSGANNPAARAVRATETGTVYSTIKEAAKSLNISTSKANKHLAGKVKKKPILEYVGLNNGQADF